MLIIFILASKSPKKKGKSKRAHVLVAAVERATANFVERGNQVSIFKTLTKGISNYFCTLKRSELNLVSGFQIAQENPEIEQEMLSTVEEVVSTGEIMSTAAKEFAGDPCSSFKRGNMVSKRVLNFKIESNATFNIIGSCCP